MKRAKWLGWALAVSFGMCLGATGGHAQFTKKHLYEEHSDQRAEIAAGLAEAKREHKRVILDFGGDWCGDCQVLDIYLHKPENYDLLTKNFVVVHLFVTPQFDNNVELAKQYGVPLGKGVPALSVLDEQGHVLYAQKTGGFADMRHMDSSAVHEFLERWKA